MCVLPRHATQTELMFKRIIENLGVENHFDHAIKSCFEVPRELCDYSHEPCAEGDQLLLFEEREPTRMAKLRGERELACDKCLPTAPCRRLFCGFLRGRRPPFRGALPFAGPTSPDGRRRARGSRAGSGLRPPLPVRLPSASSAATRCARRYFPLSCPSTYPSTCSAPCRTQVGARRALASADTYEAAGVHGRETWG